MVIRVDVGVLSTQKRQKYPYYRVLDWNQIPLSYIKANKVTKMGPDKNPDFFFAETQHIGYQWTPLDPSIQDLTFPADSGPPGH